MRRAVVTAGGLLLVALFFSGCRLVSSGAGHPPPRRSPAAGWTELSLRETAGVERRNEPVRTALPFPAGVCPAPENLRVVGSDGRELPSQRRTLAAWPDGSVRWLELGFEPSVAANATGRYRAEYGPRIKAGKVPAPLAAESLKGDIRVDTGRLLIEIPRQPPGLRIWLDADGDGKYAPQERVLAAPGLESFVELEALRKGVAAGRFAARPADGAPVLEESGPLRAVIAWRGWHEDAAGNKVCPVVVRLYAWRGKAFIRLVHTLVLSEDPAASRIAEAGLMLTLDGSIPAGPDRVLRQSVAAVKQYPDFSGFQPKAALLEGEKVLAEEPARNFLSAPAGRFALVLAVPRAVEDAPWELRIQPAARRAAAAFWPRWGKEFTEARSPAERAVPGFLEFTRTESFERYAAGEQPGKAAGAARTHELWVEFEAPEAAAGRAAGLAAMVGAPLVAWPGTERLDWSGAFGRFAAREAQAEPAATLTRGQDRLLNWLREHQRARYGWLGLWDYGDYQTIYRQKDGLNAGERWWNWHGPWGWMQGRGGLPRALLMPWLLTGGPESWEDYRAAAAHNLDVDTVHACGRRDASVGLTHGGGATHWSGRAGLGSTYPEVWVDYYYLTGEPRAREALGALVEALGAKTIGEFSEKGRALSADQAGYVRARLTARELLGEEHALSARAALDYLGALSSRELLGASPTTDNRGPATDLWPLDLAPALARYHRIFDDPLSARLIERGTRAWLSTRPTGGRGTALDRNGFESCAYAWRLTGDRWFLDRGRELAERSAAERAGATDLRSPPPADLSMDTREILELCGLPYLTAAMEEAAPAPTESPGAAPEGALAPR